MELVPALKGQYLAGLAMLRECVEKCPDDLWSSGTHPRTFWRIAYHAAFYTDLYLSKTLEDFTAWHRHVDQARILWDDDENGVPPTETTYSQADVAEYIRDIESRVDSLLTDMDLAAGHSGFSWYKIPKLDHQLLNIRHLGVHVGQLQELLYAQGVELDWVSKR
ncbi:MAG: DinB family protein [Fimbriimonadaceae bacterium]